MNIAVIGSGIGGLGAAALLAKDGHQVTIFEKNDKVGGRCNVIEEDGYKFDTGPSWYMMPDVFENFYNEFDKTTSDYLKLIRLKPQYRILLENNDYLDITGDLEVDLQTFEKIEPGCTENFMKYLESSKEKYELSLQYFMYKNFDGLMDFIKDPNVRSAGPKMSVFKTMDSYMKEYFESELLRQILQYTLVFLGGSPKTTPALFSLMTHVDFNLGVWYPDGGLYEVIKSIEDIAQEQGVDIKSNSPVDKIITEKGVAKSLVSNGETFSFDTILSNADYHHTERLLDDKRLISYDNRYWEKKTQAPSAFLLFLGIKGELPSLIHHNIFFGKNWVEHFDQIFDDPKWPTQPSVYISKTSHTDNSVSPEGYENLVLLTPIPSGLEDTTENRTKYRNFILKYVDEQLGLDILDRIHYEKMFSISEFENMFNSYEGSALGLAHTLKQSAVWRPSNISKKVSNLYFVGANTTPGIGLPVCLISSELARKRINSDS